MIKTFSQFTRYQSCNHTHPEATFCQCLQQKEKKNQPSNTTNHITSDYQSPWNTHFFPHTHPPGLMVKSKIQPLVALVAGLCNVTLPFLYRHSTPYLVSLSILPNIENLGKQQNRDQAALDPEKLLVSWYFGKSSSR